MTTIKALTVPPDPRRNSSALEVLLCATIWRVQLQQFCYPLFAQDQKCGTMGLSRMAWLLGRSIKVQAMYNYCYCTFEFYVDVSFLTDLVHSCDLPYQNASLNCWSFIYWLSHPSWLFMVATPVIFTLTYYQM